MKNLEKITSLEEIYFHDAEIGLLNVDYNRRKITIEFALYEEKKRVPISVMFEGFIFIKISGHAPWGESYYVHGVSEKEKSDLFNELKKFIKKRSDFKHYHFWLNSGDTIDILAKSFKILKKKK